MKKKPRFRITIPLKPSHNIKRKAIKAVPFMKILKFLFAEKNKGMLEEVLLEKLETSKEDEGYIKTYDMMLRTGRIKVAIQVTDLGIKKYIYTEETHYLRRSQKPPS